MNCTSIVDYLKDQSIEHSVIGFQEAIEITDVKPIDQANGKSLVWIKKGLPNKEQLLATTAAPVVIVATEDAMLSAQFTGKCFIAVSDPRLIFLRLASQFFSKKLPWQIHPSAVIDKEAVIDEEVYIGPLSYIGKSKIGKGTIIHAGCYIYDDVTIGKNVIMHSGVVVGADGFGYQKNEVGEFEKFPHLGGVVIEDEVEIGSNTCVDRGALGNTHLKKGAKIDNLVHIAHNVVVGENAAVIAHAMVGGSTKIGNGAWIAPSVALMQGLKIGENAVIGLGAVVTKHVPANETWVGNPAKELREFISMQKKLKS